MPFLTIYGDRAMEKFSSEGNFSEPRTEVPLSSVLGILPNPELNLQFKFGSGSNGAWEKVF
jgi:hypothetical protein